MCLTVKAMPPPSMAGSAGKTQLWLDYWVTIPFHLNHEDSYLWPRC